MTRGQKYAVGAAILVLVAYAGWQAASTPRRPAPAPASSLPPPAPPAPVAAPAAAAPTADPVVVQTDHPGPAGLSWGMSPAEVKKVLSKKMRLTWEGLEQDEHAWLQHYRGEFAGFAAEQVEATFAYSKSNPKERPLMVFIVTLGARDERPASRRWLDIVEKMRGAYGEPAEFTGPPEDVGATISERARQSEHFKGSLSALGGLLTASRFDQLDRQVAQGTWKPAARWRFRNHVEVIATILVEQPDRFGHRSLKPVWMFANEDLAKKFFDSADRTRDF